MGFRKKCCNLKLLYKIHASTGLIAGLFIGFICLTGALAMFRPEISREIDWKDYHFPVEPTDSPIPIQKAMERVEHNYPGYRVGRAVMPSAPQSIWYLQGDLYRFDLKPRKNENPKPIRSMRVLVDPYREAIVAEQHYKSSWANFVRQLHVRFLYGGWWGRVVVGLFGATFLVSTVTGLFVYPIFNRAQWRPRLRRKRGARLLLADSHKAIGIAALIFNLMFGLTGAVLGLENINVYLEHYGAPHLDIAPTKLGPAPEPVQSVPAGMLDQIGQWARTLVPDTYVSSFVIQLDEGRIDVKLEHSESAMIKERVSYVGFNAATGRAFELYDARDASILGRLYYAIEPLHFGRFGGLFAVKLIWAMMGLAGASLSISGYILYGLRKRRRKRTRVD